MLKFEILNRHSNAVKFVAIIDCASDAADSHKKRLAVLWALENDISLCDANLSGADLRGADLRDANLQSANLSRANLRDADLRGAALLGAILVNAYLTGANLVGADLSQTNLSRANLTGANLAGVDLRKAILTSADLTGADLSGADLSRADLCFADLSGADLRGADLCGVDLRRAILTGADLTGADVQYFKLDFWIILDQNPNEVEGLLVALQEGRVDGSTYIGACACLVGTIANLRGVAFSTLKYDASRPAERWFLMIAEGDTPETCFASAKAVEWVQEWLVR